MPDTAIYGAREVAAQIHASLAELDFSHPVAPTAKPTVSIGISCLVPRNGLEHAQLLKAADDALYDAKNGDRNRTEIASGSSDVKHGVHVDEKGRLVA